MGRVGGKVIHGVVTGKFSFQLFPKLIIFICVVFCVKTIGVRKNEIANNWLTNRLMRGAANNEITMSLRFYEEK